MSGLRRGSRRSARPSRPLPNSAAAPGRTGPAARPTHVSDDSQTLPDQRHAVKDFFPNYIRDEVRIMCEIDSRQAGIEKTEEIEITPEIVAIGVAELIAWENSEESRYEPLVERLYLKMRIL